MARESSGKLQVGSNVSLAGIGMAHFESSQSGVSNFLAREGENIVRYSAGGGISRMPQGDEYVLGDYSREVISPGSRGYSQAAETVRRARI